MDPDGNRLQNSCIVPDTGGTRPCIECPQCTTICTKHTHTPTHTHTYTHPPTPTHTYTLTHPHLHTCLHLHTHLIAAACFPCIALYSCMDAGPLLSAFHSAWNPRRARYFSRSVIRSLTLSIRSDSCLNGSYIGVKAKVISGGYQGVKDNVGNTRDSLPLYNKTYKDNHGNHTCG